MNFADIIAAIAAFLKFRTKKQELENTAEMQANARAKRDAEIRDNAAAVVKKGSLEDLRKQAAE